MTKLIAMMIARNEADRFIHYVIPALQEFVDEIRVVDDSSTDGTHSILRAYGCVVHRNDFPSFFAHEGKARNHLLDFALEGNPTHLLAIDMDEMVEDRRAVREAIDNRTSPAGVWSLNLIEIWKADQQFLWERVDGQWGARKAPVLFEVPTRRTAGFAVANRALACGREPMVVAKAAMRGKAPVVTSLFHLGWTCQADRDARYQRYVKHDGGQFHASAHLESIMFDDSRVKLVPRRWPESMLPVKDGLVARVNR